MAQAAPRPRASRPVLAWSLALLLVLIHTALLIGSLRQKSITLDEPEYLYTGTLQWRERNFLNNPHPPLMKYLVSLPLLGLDLVLPPGPRQTELGPDWNSATRFYHLNRTDMRTMLTLARLPVVLLTALLGLFLFGVARRRYGTAGGWLVLLLYLLSPNIAAHGRLATTDLGGAAFSCLALVSCGWMLESPCGRRVLLTGLAVGVGHAVIVDPVAIPAKKSIGVEKANQQIGPGETHPSTFQCVNDRHRRPEQFSDHPVVSGCTRQEPR